MPREAVLHELQGEERFLAIRELCEAVVPHADGIDSESLVEAVRERESLMGTGTGHEIAIPHARLAELRRPVLNMGRSAKGIEWNAPDGRPVHLVFLLLTPEHKHGLQLQILAALAQAMMDDGARGRLLEARSADAMWLALQDALRAQDLVRVKLQHPPGSDPR